MPFDSVAMLPERIRQRFGAKGQRTFLAAFNSAWDGTCQDREDRDACAFAVATAAANRVEKAMGLTQSERVTKSWQGRIVKADDEKQIAYMPVLVPDIEDAQEDVVTAEDVEAAAHRFAKEYAAGQAQLGLDHRSTLDREAAIVVETWIEKADVTYGEEIVSAGTWMIGVHAADAEVWQSLKTLQRTGASIEGTGIRTAA